MVVNQTTLIALINAYSSFSWVWPPLKSNAVWTTDPTLPLDPGCYDLPRTINCRTLNIQRKFQVQFLVHRIGCPCITGAITIM